MYIRFDPPQEVAARPAHQDGLMTIALLLTLAGLAVLDSTSFGTLGIPVYLMLSLDRSRTARLFVYLATVTVFYFLVGVALMLGLSTAMDAFGDVLNSRAAFVVQLVLGVGLFALSWRFDPKWRAKRGLPERTFEPRVGGPRTMVLVGLTAGVLEVATMVPYLAAVGMMTTSALPVGQWAPLLAAYVLIMILPALLLMALRAATGRRLEPRLERLRAWLVKHSSSMLSWGLAIVGFLLARDAAARLFLS
ncbi:GAP family protein [Nonomuraea gerenzanensis]|uniref:Membrane protein, putative n=1 Tax=Nonomuraea gerenzanensis TaxID=93944 RepID=A0A1M4EL64_9ACTN|nr:GAP family protein [Nonomuraea gerenzanensis]UBU11112.1 GAP family protein [Nonomuraea gerenzanensis]SBO99575.1 membrane protein, putative [Nonomuraea gerenzanensis]